MSSQNNKQNITRFFAGLKSDIMVKVPVIIAETATAAFKENFSTKSFFNRSWPQTKRPVKRGSLMVRSGALMASIRPSEVSSSRVVIQAGSSKVPYARVHNEGGLISRAARSETFVRNRYAKGKKTGRFKKGISTGKGFSYKAYSYNMPQRQFMGHSPELNRRIMKRIKDNFLK